MNTSGVTLTYREYAALPADGRRYEIHEGELSMTPAPSPQHQIVCANLFSALRAHIKTRQLGEILFAPLDVILSDISIVQPDIVYLDPTCLDRISRRGIEGPPTLVIEVLSPTTTLIDRSSKHQIYAKYGVPYFCLVDPGGRSIEAFLLGPQGYSLTLRATGNSPVNPPPFADLHLIPDSLWP